MVKDAEVNASADKEKRERIDLKNQSETLVYEAEKQLSDVGDKVSADDKSKGEGFTTQLKEAIEKDDFDTMKSVQEELQQALYAARAAVYQQGADGAAAAAGGANGAGGADSSAAGDDVIDAEFTETK